MSFVSLNPFANPAEVWPGLVRHIYDGGFVDPVPVGNGYPLNYVTPEERKDDAVECCWRPVAGSEPGVRIRVSDYQLPVRSASGPAVLMNFGSFTLERLGHTDDSTMFEDLTVNGRQPNEVAFTAEEPLRTVGACSIVVDMNPGGAPDYVTWNFDAVFVGGAQFGGIPFADGEYWVSNQALAGSLTLVPVSSDPASYFTTHPWGAGEFYEFAINDGSLILTTNYKLPWWVSQGVVQRYFPHASNGFNVEPFHTSTGTLRVYVDDDDDGEPAEPDRYIGRNDVYILGQPLADDVPAPTASLIRVDIVLNQLMANPEE